MDIPLGNEPPDQPARPFQKPEPTREDRCEKSSEIDSEIRETIEALTQSTAHLRWYVQTYLLVIAAFISIGGYVGKEAMGQPLQSGDPMRYAPFIAGISCQAIVLLITYFFLPVLAHRIRDHFFCCKHLAAMRKHRLAQTGLSSLANDYVLPLEIQHVYAPRMLRYVPLFFSIAIVMVAMGSTTFYLLLLRIPMKSCIAISITWTLFVTIFIPKILTVYFVHIGAGIKMRNAQNLDQAEFGISKAFRTIAKDKYNKRIIQWIHYAFAACSVFFTYLVCIWNQPLEYFSAKHESIFHETRAARETSIVHETALIWLMAFLLTTIVLLWIRNFARTVREIYGHGSNWSRRALPVDPFYLARKNSHTEPDGD